MLMGRVPDISNQSIPVEQPGLAFPARLRGLWAEGLPLVSGLPAEGPARARADLPDLRSAASPSRSLQKLSRNASPH